MTNEQINKVIAETCGWIERPTCTDFLGNPLLPPDYCNDLNAMREVMLTLNDKQGFGFLWHLNDMGFVGGDWELLTLDSQVLAEAFLRTLGKWEE
jgi:hypothetical protein